MGCMAGVRFLAEIMKEIFSVCLQHPDWLCDLPSLLSNGYWRLFPHG